MIKIEEHAEILEDVITGFNAHLEQLRLRNKLQEAHLDQIEAMLNTELNRIAKNVKSSSKYERHSD